jgi:hypothetical protein
VFTDFTPIGQKSSGLSSRRNNGVYTAVSILTLSAIYAVL